MINYSSFVDEKDTYYKYTPWYLSRNTLLEIYLDDGIPNIGDKAFKNLKQLRTVDLPECLKEIGIQSFYGCNNEKMNFSSGEIKKYKKEWNKNSNINKDTYDYKTNTEILKKLKNIELIDNILYDNNEIPILKKENNKIYLTDYGKEIFVNKELECELISNQLILKYTDKEE